MNQIRLFQCAYKSNAFGLTKFPFRAISTTNVTSTKLGTAPTAGSGMAANTHWTIERIVAVSMLPIYPTAWVLENQVMSLLVVTTVSLHAFWGFDGVLKDYVMERRYGPLLQPILRNIWKVISAVGFAGLLYFEYNDIGFVKGVKKLWSI